MESLLEIQQKVKELENSLKNITNTIGSINTDIQKLRVTDKDLEIDFKKLKVLSRHIPFKTHPLSELNDRHCIKLYVEILMNIIRISPEISIEKMSFVQWIIEKSKIDISFEDLYKESLEMNDKLLDEVVNYLSEDYKIYIVIDSMVIGNLTGKADVNTLNYIADICRVLGIKKDDINALAIIAKAILCQNTNNISNIKNTKFLDYTFKVKYYLNAQLIKEMLNIIMTQYRCLVELPSCSYNIVFTKNSFSDVKEDEEIGYYKIKNNSNYSSNSFYKSIANINNNKFQDIVAPISGRLYVFIDSDNRKQYGVISHIEDDPNLIKIWLANKENIYVKRLELLERVSLFGNV